MDFSLIAVVESQTVPRISSQVGGPGWFFGIFERTV